MKFGEALEIMRNGGKIKVPEWNGYWFKNGADIWVHTYDGKEFVQTDMGWNNAYIWRTDWEKAN